MPTTTTPPEPQPARLRRTATGRYPAYVTGDGRFTVTSYRPARGASEADREQAGALDVVDTRGRNILGHARTNTARVYEIADALALIDRVYRVEWLARVQAFLDAERRAAGLPTVVEAAQARMHEARSSLVPVRGADA